MIQPGFFDFSNRLKDLSSCGDPLERLLQVIDFEIFRPTLEKGFDLGKSSKGGRPPYDAILIFKILILQSLYNLSDDQTEYQIKDRLSFMRFLRLSLCQSVPDAKTIWLYRERLKTKGLMETLWNRFDQELKNKGYLAMGGQIVDATIVQAPKQRLTREEKETVKSGKIPQDWQENPTKLAQKDTDARWIVKYSKAKGDAKAVDLGIPYFGYKNHISSDCRFGFIRQYEVTDASRYDGHSLRAILDNHNTSRDVWGDTAYRTQDNEKYLEERGFSSKLHRKKPKGKVMSDHIRKGNATKSSIRSKVEHIFAVQKTRMDLFIRTIGIVRAEIKIGLANLAFNMGRLNFWERKRAYVG
jgi:IS5 family transposase